MDLISMANTHLFGTNTQQFYLTTTASLPAESDIPASGHEALRDTMTDLILDFIWHGFTIRYRALALF